MAAVLLRSGGMDSTTCLWWMREQGVADIHAVTVDYGQRHRVELEYAAAVARRARVAAHKIIRLDLTSIGGSPLTDGALDVPAAAEDRQAVTVVPFRNKLIPTPAAAATRMPVCKVIGGRPPSSDAMRARPPSISPFDVGAGRQGFSGQFGDVFAWHAFGTAPGSDHAKDRAFVDHAGLHTLVVLPR